MALKKTYETDYGNTVEYWKVVDLSINWLMKVSRITLAGYVNADARADNKIALEKKFYNVNPKEFSDYYGTEALDSANPITTSYDYVKYKDVFFSDAENI